MNTFFSPSGHINKDARFAAAHFRQTDPSALHPEDPDYLHSHRHLWLLGKKQTPVEAQFCELCTVEMPPASGAQCDELCDERPFVIV